MWKRLTGAGLVLALSVPAAVCGKDLPPARFIVRDEVAAADVRPFTATIDTTGNGSRMLPGGGFEPRIFRTWFLTTAGGRNRILADPRTLSGHDSWRTGAFDGAGIEVLRIENGAFHSVRRDRIAPGGFQASGWVQEDEGQAVPPGQTRYVFAWEHWNRTGGTDYFTVRAIDRTGALSAPAIAVSAGKPAGATPAGDRPDNHMIRVSISGQDNPDLPAPRNLRAQPLDDGMLQLAWDPVPEAAGYAIYRSDTPPGEHRGHYIDLAGDGPAIRAGDLVILRHRGTRTDRAGLVTNRIWNTHSAQQVFGSPLIRPWPEDPGGADWHLAPHETGTAVEDSGETFLRFTLLQKQQFDVGAYNHSGTGQTYYPVLEPGKTYRFEAWIRGRTPHPVRFILTGPPHGAAGPTHIPPVTFRVSPEWRKHTATFRVPAPFEGAQPGWMGLQFTGPGEFDLDNLRVFRDDAPFLALLPEDEALLENSAMAALRTHAFVKSGGLNYDLEQLTNPGGVGSIRGGNTLPQSLALMERAGVDPWLQVEPHLSREEWLGLAEYLAAPFDPATDDPEALPWAAKRHAQGHPPPWSDSFGRIYFEIGNETWNGLFSPWIFHEMRDAATGRRYSRGEVYGLYQEYVLSILRQSPDWPQLAERLIPVLGGWSGNDYGVEAAALSPHSRILTHAAYNGGWDENEGPVRPDTNGFFSILTNVLQSGLPRARRYMAAAGEISRQRDEPLRVGTYEAGPGYALNGLNGARVGAEAAALQEQAMKSAAAGTATLDTFLANARQGFTLQNFFTFGAGGYWSSHARWNLGGQSYPSWDLLGIFNREATGDMLAVETRKVPRTDLPARDQRAAVDGGPLVAVYATRKGSRLTVILISRLLPDYPFSESDGHVPVTVDLPIRDAGRLTLIRLDGSYSDNNVSSRTAGIVSEELPVPDGLPRLEVGDLPPGATLFYIFDDIR
ncbi:hypothetical protein [Tropicimonas sp.]|uniref:hypothetical protein n=1 Tax=Tropicimonas sp. TaxID=2067044 RepID=UPI003A85513F